MEEFNQQLPSPADTFYVIFTDLEAPNVASEDSEFDDCENCPDYEECQALAADELNEEELSEAESELEDDLEDEDEVPEDLQEFDQFCPPEVSRTYLFPEGDLTVDGVEFQLVCEDGTHLLETDTGRKLVVRPGWLSIELDAETWDNY